MHVLDLVRGHNSNPCVLAEKVVNQNISLHVDPAWGLVVISLCCSRRIFPSLSILVIQNDKHETPQVCRQGGEGGVKSTQFLRLTILLYRCYCMAPTACHTAPHSHKLINTLSLVCIHLLASHALWFIWYYNCAVKAHWNWGNIFCRQIFYPVWTLNSILHLWGACESMHISLCNSFAA